MDREKKQASNAHLDSVRKAWLLVIPAIIAIIGSAAFTGIWLASHSRASSSLIEIQSRITSPDKLLLANIRHNARNIYLQLLQAQINPKSDPNRIEQLSKRLDELEFQEGEIMHRYDSSYVSIRPSAMEVLFEILAEMPYPIIFTISLVVGILFFVTVRYAALLIISKRYPPSSDYVREV
jgi:hypothetical protein